MKTAWNHMKGACLVLLGLASMGGTRGLAADIQFTSFDKLASTDAVAGEASTGPFKDETAATSPLASTVADSVAPVASVSTDAIVTPCCDDCYLGTPGRIWFHADYMHWWTSGARVAPLVSTFNPNDPNNLADIHTVFGDRDVGSGDHDGYRINLGMWLDRCHRWGIEGEYFDLSGRATSYDSSLSNGYRIVDNNGTLTTEQFPLARVVSIPGANGGIIVSPVSSPTQYVGRVFAEANDYFQSAGLWLRRNLRASEWSAAGDGVAWTDVSARTFRLDAIGGYRYSRLMDSLYVQDQEMNVNYLELVPPTGGPTGNFWTQYTETDSFRSVNNFNGGELGLNAVMTRGRWSLDIMGKVALGVNNQSVQLYGPFIQDLSVTWTPGDVRSPNSPLVTSGMRPFDYSRNVFSWIPELTVTAGYQLTDNVKFTVGYDIMYWSAVARAGNQNPIDPANGLPIPIDPSTFTINQTYFWAQGLRLGGELRF